METLRRARYPFLLPAIALIALIYVFPLGVLFHTSMLSVQGYNSSWVGLSNYSLVLHDPIFAAAVEHNLILLVTCVPVLVVLAILMSVFLMERIPGWRTYRTIVFLPYVLSVPVVAVVFNNILQPAGPLNGFLRLVGLGFMAQDWLGSSNWALFTLIVMIIWKELGFAVVLFLARLLMIPPELLEAAEVDGAGWWQKLWYVIIPQLRGTIEFYAVVEGITMLSWVFNYVYIISSGTGGPGTSTMVTELYIYLSAFGYGGQSLGLATAAATMMFLGSLALILGTLRVRQGEAEV